MLNRGDVYKIRTAFGSMCQMSETWMTSQGIPVRTDRSALSAAEPGINIDYFAKSCWYLKGSKESINKRLLTAAGK